MNIGILGTGMVGQSVAGKLADLGHNVVIGTRDVSATLANTSPNAYGLPPFSAWYKEQSKVKLVTFSEAAAHGEMLINCTAGIASLDALKAAGE